MRGYDVGLFMLLGGVRRVRTVSPTSANSQSDTFGLGV
jgi:hypothetical protein